MTKTEAPRGAQAVFRAISILKAFSPDKPKLTVQELSDRLNLTKTTTHRLLSVLEGEGLVARNTLSNTYQLGSAVIALGSQALLNSDLRVVARPWLERLAEQTKETCTLELLAGDHVLVLDGIPGKHLVSAYLDIGTRWPLHACSTGKAMLSMMEPRLWDHHIGANMVSLTERTIVDRDAFKKELGQAQINGYAVSVEEVEPDYVAVGAAFRDSFGLVEGALSVGGPASRFNRRKIKQLGLLLRNMTKELSHRHKS